MKHVSTNMAVVVAANLGQIWEIKHNGDETVVIVTADKDNMDYQVVGKLGSFKVTIEPWVW